MKLLGKKLSKNRKKYVVLPVVAVVVLASLLIYVQLKQPSPYAGLEARIQAELEVAKLKQNRPDYLPAIVYQNLPAFPKDFYEIDTMVKSGLKTDLLDLSEDYYGQPEFYPAWERTVPYYQNPDQTRRGVFGYGAYPGDIGVETAPGSSFDIGAFFHAGYQTETYQGMALAVTYPDFASIPTKDLSGSLPVYQDTSSIGDYFTVTFEPDAFVLEPAFPIFQKGWTQKVKINVTVAEDTPKARYVIGVNPVAPPNSLRNQWVDKYRLKYVDAGGHFVGRPFFQLTVDVV